MMRCSSNKFALAVLVAWATVVVSAIAQEQGTPQGFGTSPAGSASNSQPAAERGNGSSEEDRRERRRRGSNRGDRGPDGERGNGERRRRREEGENRDRESARTSASSSSTAAAASKPAANDVSDAQKTRDWARATFREHDKNGDMILDKSEQAGLGQSVKADTNGDGKITVDELVIFASPKSASSTTVTTSGTSSVAVSGSPAGSSNTPPADAKSVSSTSGSSSHKPGDGAKGAKDKRKSYRFKSAKDRLPAGLPGWFTSKDANADGQVSMSEYSRSWSDRTASEFQKYDHDNDGVITAEEAGKK